jgi:Zn2+/Cd2+-exporting ATPase
VSGHSIPAEAAPGDFISGRLHRHSAISDTPLLSRAERLRLGLRLTVALVTAGLLLLSFGLRLLAPDQGVTGELVAGAAALIIAVPALSAAYSSLRDPDLHGVTDQLIGLAVIAAWADGDLTTAALLPLLMTIGHILEERSLLGSEEAIRGLVRLTESRAWRRDPGGATVPVSASALHVGDLVEVRPGDCIPADGVVREGRSAVDTAPISGESIPVEAVRGSILFGGSINLDGRLLIEITRIGAETALGRIISLIQAAERAKPPVTRLLERYAGRYMVLVLLIAAASWFATGAIAGPLAVLVAACPCALVMAAPATSVAAIAVAARHGILVRGSAFLENLAAANAVVLDKTGTVTFGQVRVYEVRPEPQAEVSDLMRVAATLGAASNHPVSRALAELVPRENQQELTEIREVAGLGIKGVMAGHPVAVGRRELFVELGIATPDAPSHVGPIAGVAADGRFLGWVLLADEPRPEARKTLDDLASLGLRRQILLTGDQRAVALSVGHQLGIDDVRAQALPEQKLEAVRDLTRAGFRPMVVGDGINDSLALKAGAVGVAMGATGSDLAIASADIVLLGNNLHRLATSVRLSQRCRRTIHTNVALGLGWTAVLTSAAAFGFLGASGALIAALLHNLGTLAVIANAGLLLRFEEA